MTVLAQQFKALIVDDDRMASRLVGLALSEEGFKCGYAYDGNDALRRLAAEQFDLIVTDLRMPNKHGYDLAVEILARKIAAVLVIYTCVDDPRLTKDLVGRGVDDIVYKPANHPAFAAKMSALVQRRKSSAAAPAQETSPADPSCPVPQIGWADYERRLANVHTLFPLSSAAYDVYGLSSREDVSTGTLAGAMMRDAALMTDVLRLANSPFYLHNGRPTTDVEEAIMRIGFKRVGEVALALNALGAIRGCVLPWLDAELYQARSLAASIALEHLCKIGDYRATNDGMTVCGFLHPLGRLVLGSAFPNEYQSLIQFSLERLASLSDLESHVFPESHTAALGRVLSRWNVPGAIWTPLGHLADSYDRVAELESPIRDRVEVIKVAVFVGQIAVGRWMPWDQIDPPPARVLTRLGVPHLVSLIEQTRTVMERVAPGGKARIKDEPSQRLRYCDLSGGRGDWMATLLQSLGFDTITPEPRNGQSAGGMVVNCLDASPGEIVAAGRRQDCGGQERLFFVARNHANEIRESGMAMRFPASVAALKASCATLATSN
jgi:HD-like signal output (HDOD) protein/DNA-binding NarL/FixJ family response regulator